MPFDLTSSNLRGSHTLCQPGCECRETTKLCPVRCLVQRFKLRVPGMACRVGGPDPRRHPAVVFWHHPSSKKKKEADKNKKKERTSGRPAARLTAVAYASRVSAYRSQGNAGGLVICESPRMRDQRYCTIIDTGGPFLPGHWSHGALHVQYWRTYEPPSVDESGACGRPCPTLLSSSARTYI